jgi:hypothetical protein
LRTIGVACQRIVRVFGDLRGSQCIFEIMSERVEDLVRGCDTIAADVAAAPLRDERSNQIRPLRKAPIPLEQIETSASIRQYRQSAMQPGTLISMEFDEWNLDQPASLLEACTTGGKPQSTNSRRVAAI